VGYIRGFAARLLVALLDSQSTRPPASNDCCHFSIWFGAGHEKCGPELLIPKFATCYSIAIFVVERRPMPTLTVKGDAVFGRTVDLDNKRFLGCKFTNCTLRYKGGQLEWDKDTAFISCQWEFLEAAKRTVKVRDAAQSGDLINFHWSGEAFSAL
jgi:hypothetical protein